MSRSTSLSVASAPRCRNRGLRHGERRLRHGRSRQPVTADARRRRRSRAACSAPTTAAGRATRPCPSRTSGGAASPTERAAPTSRARPTASTPRPRPTSATRSASPRRRPTATVRPLRRRRQPAGRHGAPRRRPAQHRPARPSRGRRSPARRLVRRERHLDRDRRRSASRASGAAARPRAATASRRSVQLAQSYRPSSGRREPDAARARDREEPGRRSRRALRPRPPAIAQGVVPCAAEPFPADGPGRCPAGRAAYRATGVAGRTHLAPTSTPGFAATGPATAARGSGGAQGSVYTLTSSGHRAHHPRFQVDARNAARH